MYRKVKQNKKPSGVQAMRKKKKPYFTLFGLAAAIALMLSCSNPLENFELTNPLTHDNKLALVLKRYQYTTCKQSCLVEEYLWETYSNVDTGKTENYYRCPTDYLEFICIDLYKKDKEEKNVTYKLSPQEWQTHAKHLFGMYSNKQIQKGLAQFEFLCKQDFAACEDKLEVIEALKAFYYERSK